MSVKLYGWAWGQRGIGSTARLVLLALAERADNRKHECFPTQTHIAEMTGLQERSVIRAMKVLVEAGLVTRERRQRQDGSRTSDLYRMHPEITVGLTDSESHDSESHDSLSPDSESGPTRQRVTPNLTESHPQPDRESVQEEPITVPSLNPSPTHHSETGFKDFYAAYPKKKAKDAARKAWAKAIKRADPAAIVDAAGRYAEQRRFEDAKFTPYPATWLNRGQWEDEAPEPQQALTSTNQKLYAIAQEHRAQETQHAAIGHDGTAHPHRGIRSA